MLTSYPAVHPKYVEGMPLGDWRDTRPMTLPYLAQITAVTTANGSGTDDWVITIVDDETGQTYSVTATGDATEADLDANMEAAFAAHSKLPSLFTLSVTSTSNVVATFTAKHANRSYTFSATGGTGANTISTSQAAGGSGIEFGRMVARGTGDKEFRALTSTDTLADLVGALFRTEGNHFHSLENDTPSAVDASRRGWTYPIAEKIRMAVVVEDAVTPASKVYVRRALTSSAGSIGAFRGSPAGSAQVSTFAPTADLQVYGLHLAVKDSDGHVRDFQALYRPTDGTTAVADAIDGLYDALVDVLGGATSAANGLGVTITESDTLLTITTDSGVEIVDLSSSVYDGDTEVVTGTAVVGSADVDTIDISSIARFETSASAGGFAELRIDMR